MLRGADLEAGPGAAEEGRRKRGHNHTPCNVVVKQKNGLKLKAKLMQ